MRRALLEQMLDGMPCGECGVKALEVRGKEVACRTCRCTFVVLGQELVVRSRFVPTEFEGENRRRRRDLVAGANRLLKRG